MARDRQRAKQRKARRHDASGPPTPSQPQRSNVPPDWEHGGEVDEFEAALVAGAEGETVDGTPAEEAELEREATEQVGDLDDDGDVDEDDRALATTRGRTTAKPARTGGPRFIVFLRACWAELQRVQWPDRRQVAQATAVVLGFVVIAGAYLGIADKVAQEIVDLII
jgi:preprotein translocase subunit SecE